MRRDGTIVWGTPLRFMCRQLFFCAVLAGVGAGQCANWVDGMCPPVVQGNFHSFAVFDDGTGSKLYCAQGIGPGPGPTFPSVIGVWNGTTWSFISPPVTGGTIRSVCVYDDGTGPSLYISGTFTNPNRIAKWDGGANVTPLGAGVNSAPNGMLVHDDGSGPKLFVYGNLSMAGGMPANRMAKWDGAAWSSAGWVGIGPVAVAVSSSAVGGPALYASGFDFSISANSVRRLAGGSWTTLGTCGNQVLALGELGNEVFVGGSFSLFNGVAADYVARWNGMTWSGCPGAPIANTMALQSFNDGTGPAIFKVGAGANGTVAAKWNGQTWTTMSSPAIYEAGIDSIGLPLFDAGSGLSLFCGGSDLGGNAALSKLAAAGPPSIVVQPVGQAAAIGAPFTLTVAAVGTAPMSYSWRRNGSPTGAPSSPTMTVAAAQPGDAGMYDVVITNPCGSSTSAAVSVTVFSPVLSLGQTGPGGGCFISNANLVPGREYFNVFSLESCAAGVGSGPYLGLCATNLAPLLSQVQVPVGAVPFHFVPSQVAVLFGPFLLQPGLHFEGLCFDFTGGTLNGYSQVAALDTL